MVRVAVMVRVWERMQGQFGRRWTDQFGHGPFHANSEDLTTVAVEWNIAMNDLTPDQISTGLNALITSGARFVPSAGEFRELCFAFPSLAECEAYMQQRAAPSPFTVAVARAISGGSWKYRHASAEKAERMLLDAYTETKKAIMSGHLVLHPLDKAIEYTKPKHVPCTPETAELHIETINALLRRGRSGEP